MLKTVFKEMQQKLANSKFIFKYVVNISILVEDNYRCSSDVFKSAVQIHFHTECNGGRKEFHTEPELHFQSKNCLFEEEKLRLTSSEILRRSKRLK